MSEAERKRHIQQEIATLEADCRHLEVTLRQKKTLLGEVDGDQANEVRKTITGIESLLTGNRGKIADYKRQL